MKQKNQFGLFIILLYFLISCNGQTRDKNQSTSKTKIEKAKFVGGSCDGCEIMYVGMPKNIKPIDTSADWGVKGQKLFITGTVYKLDGKTRAPNIIIYYWHTDNNGYYSQKKGINELAMKHGYIRGWIKTDVNGRYAICTTKPAPYPNDILPAHIHFSIKEPNIENEYYTDDINFDNDKLLIPYFKKYPPENRGGSGVVNTFLKGDIQIVEHNIVLGLNIPNYPKK